MKRARRWMWILWPGFLMAIPAVGIAFTLVDPADMHLFGKPLAWSRLGVYTAGFFLFWLLGACCSALTMFLQRSARTVNREVHS